MIEYFRSGWHVSGFIGSVSIMKSFSTLSLPECGNCNMVVSKNICYHCEKLTNSLHKKIKSNCLNRHGDLRHSALNPWDESYFKIVPDVFEFINELLNENFKLSILSKQRSNGNSTPTKFENNTSKHIYEHPKYKSMFIAACEFQIKLKVILSWFQQFTSNQKNRMLQDLMKSCGPSQNHMISHVFENRLHADCPPNCQDFISWLPASVTLKIMSFLDPISLAKCSAVCRSWKVIADTDVLWKHLCKQFHWKFSQTGENRQISLLRDSAGTLKWKMAFADRYKVRSNWLKGQCHVRTFEGHSQAISCVQFDESRIVSGSHDKTIKVWNRRTNSPWSVITLVGHSGTVRCLHLHGNRLVSGSSDKTIKVWDLDIQPDWSSIACKVTMIGHSDTVRCLQADKSKILSGSYDWTIKVWNSRTGECLNTLGGHEGPVLCMHYVGNKVVSGSSDNSIKVWYLPASVCIMTLKGHDDSVTCVTFDSYRIVSGSLDRTIKFWDHTTGICLSTIDWMKSEGHTGVIRCLQADSWRVVSGGDDKAVKVWSLETGKRLVTMKNHTDGVTCLQFNDSQIVSGSYDKTVKLWDFTVC